jgi:hypothetical protein
MNKQDKFWAGFEDRLRAMWPKKEPATRDIPYKLVGDVLLYRRITIAPEFVPLVDHCLNSLSHSDNLKFWAYFIK